MILLTILKIIGIILLVLLGLIILLLCLLLFAPVRYRAEGAKHPDELTVSAFVSYLWPLIRVRVEYPSETILSVKILWIDLLHPKEKKAREKKHAGKSRNKPDKQHHQESDAAEPDKPQRQENDTAEPGKTQRLENDTVQPLRADTIQPEEYSNIFPDDSTDWPDITAEEIVPDKKTAAKDTGGHKKAEKKSTEKKKSTSHTGKNTENKLIAIAALLWQYKEMYPDVLGRVFHALKSILPRRCNIHLIFGTGSPDNTGYLYGAYCALQEYLPGTIMFEPVWMESYLDVKFDLSGKIRLIHFVTAAVKIIADKRVRKFVSEIRRL